MVSSIGSNGLAPYEIIQTQEAGLKIGETMKDLWNGEQYHSNSKLQESLARDFLSVLQKQIPPGSLLHAKFLDIGSGDGFVTSLLSEYFPKITTIGVDSSPDMVHFANGKFGSRGLSFNVDRAEELKTIGDEQIDAITSFSCLLWVKDLKNAFEAMHRVLKPGGWIGLQFPAEDYLPCAIDDAYAQILKEEPWKSYLSQKHEKLDWNNADLNSIRADLLDAGFKIEKIEFAYWNYRFPDKKSFRDCLAAGFQMLKVVPMHLHNACVDRLIDLYLEITAARQPADGSCVYEVNGLQIIARK